MPTDHNRFNANPDAPKLYLAISSDEGRKIYKKGKQSVEPGFDQFLRRGFNAVNAEWNLVCTAHNLKRMWRIATTDPLLTECASG